MKVAKIRFGICREVPLHSIETDRDNLFRTVTKRGKKIVSGNQELDEEVIEQLKKHKVRKVWIKKGHYEWVSRSEARERDPHLEEVKEVPLDLAKALLKLSKIDTVYQLRVLITEYRQADISNALDRKCRNLLSELDDLQPEVEHFREHLKAIDDDKVQRKVVKLLNQPPEKIKPGAVPQQSENLVRNYLDYLSHFYDLHFKMAGIIFEGGKKKAKKIVS